LSEASCMGVNDNCIWYRLWQPGRILLDADVQTSMLEERGRCDTAGNLRASTRRKMSRVRRSEPTSRSTIFWMLGRRLTHRRHKMLWPKRLRDRHPRSWLGRNVSVSSRTEKVSWSQLHLCWRYRKSTFSATLFNSQADSTYTPTVHLLLTVSCIVLAIGLHYSA